MKLAELAAYAGGRLEGDGAREILSVGSLEEAGPGELSFLAEAKYLEQVRATRAGAVLVGEDFSQKVSAALVFVTDVNEALEKVLTLFGPEADWPGAGVHARAEVAATAKLGEGVSVGPNVVIGENVTIGAGSKLAAGCVIGRGVRMGKGCCLGANVVIHYGCVLGDRVQIYANSTIGADGFGYRLVEGRHRKIPHIGTVVIEDEVEIGANSCVDRAKFGKTVIGRGTKIDNLVQIAHNVRIGENCIIVSQTGIAGSTELGKYVVLGGQCGIGDHVKIGDGVMAGATTHVAGEVAAGEKIVGTPHRPVRVFFRELSLIQKLPELAKEVKTLRRQINDIATAKDDH